MKKRLLQTSLLIIILGLMWISSLREVLSSEYSFASNYDRTYTFDVQYGYYRLSHRLYTSVPPSLYEYYQSKSHLINGDSDYSKFVTPGAFKSIAESIQNVTRNKPYSDEDFANAVLMLVRQVSYVRSNVKYPVEAIVDNSGDCDVLSLLAASIMKAGGLDVVLLYYKGLSPSHMNVGVYLPYTPVYRTWWMTPTGYEYNNKTYWMAECTSLGEWKVADQPGLLAGAKPQIISLENCEESSPAHVSSSLDSPLIPSSISINLSPENLSISGGEPTLTISGSISPAYLGKSIVMYVSHDGTSHNTFRTVSTDDLGNYSLTWNFTSTGTYYIRTSWSGASNYAGADSETITVFIGFPKSLVQFEGPDYDYVLGLAGAAAYELRIRQGVQEFLSIHLSGTGVLLSGEFIMLRSGQTTTISRSGQRISSWQTITITTGVQPLRLPDNFNLTVNNQFGFILRNNGGNNYTASVKVLDDDGISQITKQLGGNNTAFMNATMSTKENTWYKVVARISEGAITAELYAENGTLLKSIAASNDTISVNESGILIAYDASTVIAFKNLKAETLDQPTPPVGGNQIPVYDLEWRRGG
ncbi:Ig-like domain-containing protein [Candidatus Bathyarchaeota archaeon]|nr:Ig-like domain-containing protein [Candidatus Bathyarchaeota archaeon]